MDMKFDRYAPHVMINPANRILIVFHSYYCSELKLSTIPLIANITNLASFVTLTFRFKTLFKLFVFKFYCPRRDFAQKAKFRGGTLVTRAYIKESTYS